jgi:hypothetical protein
MTLNAHTKRVVGGWARLRHQHPRTSACALEQPRLLFDLLTLLDELTDNEPNAALKGRGRRRASY